MVLSLAPIIKESVTKPNVSLTQARITGIQKCFQHARNGHVSEAGEGTTIHPEPCARATRALPSTVCRAACPQPGGQRGTHRGGPARRCWGHTVSAGAAEPCTSPTPIQSGAVSGHPQPCQLGRWEYLLAESCSPQREEEIPFLTCSLAFTRTLPKKSRFPQWTKAGLLHAALHASEQKAA